MPVPSTMTGAVIFRCKLPTPAAALTVAEVVQHRRHSGLLRQQRDALDAEFLAGALGVVRNELILLIVFHLDDAQSRRLDLATIVGVLCRATDAGGPQGRVAHNALW